MKIRGCGTALVTPFDAGNRLDLDAYREIIRWQIEAGIDFLVPVGTTGESVTLEENEYRQVIGTCVEETSNAVPVVAGAGTNDTGQAVRLARIAVEEGADAILSVTPYYNKPTQEGIFRHFKKIAEAIPVPVVLYNVPGRTGTNVKAETTLRLAEIDNIAGVKEASGDLDQIMTILKDRPAEFSVLSGDDDLAFVMTTLGGDGVISVASNVIPAEMSKMIDLASCGKTVEARELHYKFLNLMRLNFVESNPIPVKYALCRMGKVDEIYRLPLCPMAEANKRRMDRELEELKLVSST